MTDISLKKKPTYLFKVDSISLSAIMSTVMPEQPQKEEEEDEEQGEEFVFEDSTDEENLLEESEENASESAPLSERENNETSRSNLQTHTENKSQDVCKDSPPAGQEGESVKDATTIPLSGKYN